MPISRIVIDMCRKNGLALIVSRTASTYAGFSLFTLPSLSSENAIV